MLNLKKINEVTMNLFEGKSKPMGKRTRRHIRMILKIFTFAMLNCMLRV